VESPANLRPGPSRPGAAICGTGSTKRSGRTFHFVSGRNFGLFLINFCKELPYIVKQEIGLFQSGEVSALRHLRPLYDVVSPSNPAKRRDSYLPRKIRIPHRSLQARR
jgi:hypothetical protein